MRGDKLSIEIEAKLTISDETAETCLKLIEIWLNESPDRRVRGGLRHDDGKVTPFQLEKGGEAEEREG